MAILEVGDYPAVRSALLIGLDAKTLPDATIGLDIFIGRAERELRATLPDLDTLLADEDESPRVLAAAVYLAAAAIAPSMASILEKRAQEIGLRYASIDWALRESQLRANAAAELDALLPNAAAGTERPRMFGVAAGRRGRW